MNHNLKILIDVNMLLQGSQILCEVTLFCADADAFFIRLSWWEASVRAPSSLRVQAPIKYT